MFFVIPIPFRTYRRHFRRLLNSFWYRAEQRWFRENQRWTTLKQRWSALVFLTHSETALISAEIYEISKTALFSSDLLWDASTWKKNVSWYIFLSCTIFLQRHIPKTFEIVAFSGSRNPSTIFPAPCDQTFKRNKSLNIPEKNR